MIMECARVINENPIMANNCGFRSREWYNRPWNYILRHPNTNVGFMLGKIARLAARNRHTYFDNEGTERGTFILQLAKADYLPEKISNECYADCYTAVSGCVIAVGKRMGITKLCEMDPYSDYGTIIKNLTSAEYLIHDDDKYINSNEYLLPGDILVSDDLVAINLSAGNKSLKEV